ncbi:sensor domain-containing diguanylate cyclase [Oribacterium sp. FC2011]|uniref:sensor domain-containing diguanylate cyclase n=1 Tax=Oribacterium sp. FC2011 TaxID=1408311 RepID=UPI0004E2473A|nr:diguanylate cyclase [Oribacterium sp. FC2011]
MKYVETTADKNLDDILAENRGLYGESNLIVFVSGEELHLAADKIYSNFPGVDVIGFHSFMFRHGTVDTNGTVLMIFDKNSPEYDFQFGIINGISANPIKNVLSIQKQVEDIKPGEGDTVCFEFCTGNEDHLLTTLNAIIKDHGIMAFGLTAVGQKLTDQSYVFYNGLYFDDACVYVMIKNNYGRIITYSQNIYMPHDDSRIYIATKVDKKTQTLLELNGRPAAEVYCEDLGLPIDEIESAFPYHPLCKVIGQNTYPVSVRACIKDGGLRLFKQINQNDMLYIADLGDYKKIITDHFENLKKDVPNASTIMTIDCIYRYMLFENENMLDWYANFLNKAGRQSLGIMGAGEQYDLQHCNQTMISAVFVYDKDKKQENIEASPKNENSMFSTFSYIRNEETGQDEGSLSERIYPLDYMINYIRSKKDSIVQEETSILSKIVSGRHDLRQKMPNNPSYEELYKLIMRLIQEGKDIADTIATINLHIEDIGNMLDQTEYLINDVVYTDGLTGLKNRTFYNNLGDAFFNEAEKKSGLSMAFFDIDDFKHFNTDFGHDFGDEVLRRLAQEIKRFFITDTNIHIIRMGGDEFVVLNPAALSYEDFVDRMDKVRKHISEYKVEHDGKTASLTISIGMADSRNEEISNLWNLYRVADMRLYDAKDLGKNALKAYD